MNTKRKRRQRVRRPLLYIDTPTRAIFYRTRLSRNLQACLRFARMIDANAQYEQAQVVVSQICSGDGWFVIYKPAADTREARLIERLQKDRIDRAMKERSAYTWRQDNREPDAWYVTTLHGEYRVTSFSCTCSDHAARCSKIGSGILCKHRLSLAMRQGDAADREENSERPEIQFDEDIDGDFNPFADIADLHDTKLAERFASHGNMTRGLSALADRGIVIRSAEGGLPRCALLSVGFLSNVLSLLAKVA